MLVEIGQMFEKFALLRYLKVKEYHKIFKNITNFSLFQLTNYLVPLITIPYVVHIIGAEKFGILSYAQAVVYYFSIIVDYGFDISATQKIAQSKGDIEKNSETICAVWIIKFALMLCVSLVLFLIILLTNEGRKNYLIYLLTFAMIPGNILISIWFYLGTEEMQYMNYTNFIARIVYLFGILIFLKHEVQFWIVPAINSASLFMAAIMGLFILFMKFKIKFRFPSSAGISFYLIDGWHIFISNIAINLYRNSNVLILGLFASKEIVGFYSAGEKIIKVIQSIFTPITQVFYPYISRQKVRSPEKSLTSIRLLIIYLGSASAILSVILLFTSQPIGLFLLGEKFTSSIPVIRICSFAVLFSLLNYTLGIIFMLNFNMKKEFSYSVIITGILNIIFCSVLCYYFLEIGAAVSFITAEIFLFISMIYFIFTRQEKWRLINAK